jgi:hypothetical protein
VYLREEQLLPKLDAWLSRKFDPVAFTSAVREFEASRPDESKPDQGAQQEIAECDAKLRQHRAALEAGADPVLGTSWMKETQARRALAEARLKKPAGRRRMTQEEIMTLATEMGGIMQALKDGDPADKAEIYSRIGLTLTYYPQEKRVAAEARPESIMYVRECPRGDLNLNPEAREISPVWGNFHGPSITAGTRRRHAFRVASCLPGRAAGDVRGGPLRGARTQPGGHGLVLSAESGQPKYPPIGSAGNPSPAVFCVGVRK